MKAVLTQRTTKMRSIFVTLFHGYGFRILHLYSANEVVLFLDYAGDCGKHLGFANIRHSIDSGVVHVEEGSQQTNKKICISSFFAFVSVVVCCM